MGPRLDPNEIEDCCGDGTVSAWEECDPQGWDATYEHVVVADYGFSLADPPTMGAGFFLRVTDLGQPTDPTCNLEVVPCNGYRLAEDQSKTPCNPNNEPCDPELYDLGGAPYRCRGEIPQCSAGANGPQMYSATADVGFSLRRQTRRLHKMCNPPFVKHNSRRNLIAKRDLFWGEQSCRPRHRRVLCG